MDKFSHYLYLTHVYCRFKKTENRPKRGRGLPVEKLTDDRFFFKKWAKPSLFYPSFLTYITNFTTNMYEKNFNPVYGARI